MTLDELNETKVKVDNELQQERDSSRDDKAAKDTIKEHVGATYWPGYRRPIIGPRLPGFCYEEAIVMDDAARKVVRQQIRKLIADGHLGATEMDNGYDCWD